MLNTQHFVIVLADNEEESLCFLIVLHVPHDSLFQLRKSSYAHFVIYNFIDILFIEVSKSNLFEAVWYLHISLFGQVFIEFNGYINIRIILAYISN